MVEKDDSPSIEEQLGQRDTRTILFDTVEKMRQIESRARKLETQPNEGVQVDSLYRQRAKLVALTPFRLLNASDPISTDSSEFRSFQACAVEAIELLGDNITGMELETFLKPMGIKKGESNEFEEIVDRMYPSVTNDANE